MGRTPPPAAEEFTLAGDGTGHEDDHALGVSWVLAGSSLGNRSIASELKHSGHGDWPSRFLLDPAMLTFWKDLRVKLECAASEARIGATSRAAIAVFDHFLAHASRPSAPSPARVAEAP